MRHSHALTAECCARLGAAGLAQCKPRLNAGALVAAVAGVTQLKCGMVQRARGRAMVKLGRSRETVEGHDGICHDFHGEIPEEPRRETIRAREA